jgi:hypothetical protein
VKLTEKIIDDIANIVSPPGATMAAPADLSALKRFNEWSGEGGGVYEREDGEYVLLADVQALLAAHQPATQAEGK